MSRGTPVHTVSKPTTLRLYQTAVVCSQALTREAVLQAAVLWDYAIGGRDWKRVLVRRSLLLIAAICCGLVIAQAEKLLPPIHTGVTRATPSTGTSSTQRQSVMTGPAQQNPLFATYPTWVQNFNTPVASHLDNQYWEAVVGPAQNSNNEAEYYTNSTANLRVENGALTLEATRQPEPNGYDYASARIDTQNKKSFLYGRLDVTAKLPSGAGTWPAVWLLPTTNTYENLSPASDTTRYKNGGEIDLLESVGFDPNIEYGVAHTLGDLSRPGGIGAYGTVTVPTSSSSYNLYSLLWTPTTVTFAVNNQPFYTYTKTTGADYTSWPFDQPFYLIINLAMGGTWGGQDTAAFPGNGIDNNALPASLAIQSIYYYPYVGSSTSK
jgi:beta-glucanase (GH16 family)